jgi:hypothetical protein
MSETWKWAPYSRVREAADEIKGIIRARYPDAEFRLVRSENSRRAWHLLTTTDEDAFEEIGELVNDRLVDMLAEEHIPLYVISLQRDPGVSGDHRMKRMRKTG